MQRPQPNLAAFARGMGCTLAQVQAQLAKNKRQLQAMHGQAVRTGKKVNGYTADELKALVDKV